MNTNMTGLRWFIRSLCFLVLWTKVASVSIGRIKELVAACQIDSCTSGSFSARDICGEMSEACRKLWLSIHQVP